MNGIQFIKLLRPINLLVVALIMYTLRIFILKPALPDASMTLQLGELDFFLLVLSTVLLGAAGNIINDYFDMRTDRINRPDKIILGRYVKRRVGMLAHAIINTGAIGIALYLSFKVGNWQLSMIHIFAAGSLWYYSLVFKRQFLIGNVVVAILGALVPLLVGVYELPLLAKAYAPQLNEWFSKGMLGSDASQFFTILWAFCLAYTGFAFITTLIREIQKDMADVEGDERVGCKTLPIVLKAGPSKAIVSLLMLGTIGAFGYLVWNYLEGTNTLIYAGVAVILPLAASMFYTVIGTGRKHYLIASNLMKVAMVTAVLLPVIFPFF